MKRGTLVACCLLGVVSRALSAAPCPMMLVASTTGEAASGIKDFTLPDGRVAHVKGQPVLTFKDFTEAKVTGTGRQVLLSVVLTPAGSKRWMDFTANNVGVMVTFIVDNKVVVAPRIVSPSKGAGLSVGPFDRAEAQKLADAINRGCDGR